jgi:hypothetical protein
VPTVATSVPPSTMATAARSRLSRVHAERRSPDVSLTNVEVGAARAGAPGHEPIGQASTDTLVPAARAAGPFTVCGAAPDLVHMVMVGGRPA